MNKFIEISKEDFYKLNNENFFWVNGFNVVLSCQYIQSWEQLAESLGNAFQFPMRNEQMDGTWDWLTDLSWLGNQKIIRIYFYESKYLLKSNPAFKEKIFCWLKDLIEFWREDVKTTFIAGKPGEPKEIDIYMVD